MKFWAHFGALTALALSAPVFATSASEAPVVPGTSAEASDLGTWELLGNPNMAANVGVWDSHFYVRDRKGNLMQQYRARKNMQVYGNVYYQVNEYWYEDGTYKKVRFIGVPRNDGSVETDSPDRGYFKRLQRVYASMGPTIAIWTLRDRKSGQDLGAEFVTTFENKRTATPHFYEVSKERREQLGVRPEDPPIGQDATTTIIETRAGPMVSDKPLFTLTAQEKKDLLPIFHNALK